MKIDIVYPVLPPAINGIGDHTVMLAHALAAQGHEVRVLTRADPGRAPMPAGVQAVDVWSAEAGETVAVEPLVRAIAAVSPDAVVVQFEQFSYGARGFNPRFATLFRRLRRRGSATVGVLYAHETYVTPDRLRWVPIWAYQRAQFTSLARSAAIVCVAAEAWVERTRRLGRRAEVIPIFANIPVVEGGAPATEIADDQVAVLWFGYLDARRAPFFDACLRALQAIPGVVLVYAGKDYAMATERLSRSEVEHRVIADPSPAALSSLLRAADLVVAPFPDGVSGRRSSFLAALAHGARIATNLGPSTDESLRSAAAAGLFAAVDGTDVDTFATIVRDELANLRPRTSRQDPVDPAVVAYYDDRYSPRGAATRMRSLIDGARVRADRMELP